MVMVVLPSATAMHMKANTNLIKGMGVVYIAGTMGVSTMANFRKISDMEVVSLLGPTVRFMTESLAMDSARDMENTPSPMVDSTMVAGKMEDTLDLEPVRGKMDGGTEVNGGMDRLMDAERKLILMERFDMKENGSMTSQFVNLVECV